MCKSHSAKEKNTYVYRSHDGNAEANFPDGPKMFYQQQYYEALDLIVSSIKDRFDQPGYWIYQQLEDLMLIAI